MWPATSAAILSRVVAARLNDCYILLWIEFPVSQQHARDKIRRRAVATDGQPFTFKISGCLDALACDKAQRNPVHPYCNAPDIQDARRLQVKHCRDVRVC